MTARGNGSRCSSSRSEESSDKESADCDKMHLHKVKHRPVLPRTLRVLASDAQCGGPAYASPRYCGEKLPSGLSFPNANRVILRKH